jgi:GGDEF domain-containing protein
LADADQTLADTDQTSADRDQVAADRDQVASDQDQAAGVDSEVHRLSADIRRFTTRLRAQSAQARLDAASQRDAVAGARDLVAIARDQAADARDLAMAQNDATHNAGAGRADFVMEIVIRAAEHRRQAAEYRAQAAEHRALAAADRRAAADDREQAADERLRALADREMYAAALAFAETDELTGARTRSAGLRELQREVDRCRRTHSGLVIVYVDVVGLKQVNDSRGHTAGDDLLRAVIEMLRANLRSFDQIVRIGGDEFVCALSNVTDAAARERFGAINPKLAGIDDCRGVRTGFAMLRAEDTVAELIARADFDLTRR